MEDRDGNTLSGGWPSDWIREIGSRIQDTQPECPKGVWVSSFPANEIRVYRDIKGSNCVNWNTYQVPEEFQEVTSWNPQLEEALSSFKQQILNDLSEEEVSQAAEAWEYNHTLLSQDQATQLFCQRAEELGQKILKTESQGRDRWQQIVFTIAAPTSNGKDFAYLTKSDRTEVGFWTRLDVILASKKLDEVRRRWDSLKKYRPKRFAQLQEQLSKPPLRSGRSRPILKR